MQNKPQPDPSQIQALLQRAWNLHQAGQLEQAETIYRNILSVAPPHPDANNLMGLLCIQAKRPEKAEGFIRTALRSDPENPQSHYNLGIACKDLGRFSDSARHFGRAAKLQPDNAEALSSQGNALRLSGDAVNAVKTLEAAVRLAPANRGARHNLGQALNDLGAGLVKRGETDKATKCFRKSLEYTPNHPRALANLGITLEQQGELAEAARYYQAAIRAKPDFAEPHFFLSHLRTHRSSEKEVSAMRTLLDKAETPEPDRIRLAFGLGFALESSGDYAQAFHYMSEGHRLQGKESGFSLEAESKRFTAVRKMFSAEHIAAMAGAGTDDDRPVFIVGMPRSGTTLTEQILASHPEVHGAGERTRLAEIAKSLAVKNAGDLSHVPDETSTARWRDAARDYLDHVATDAGNARRIIDTTPMNFLNIGVAAILFPRARFIICLREPMDNCLSIYRQYLTGANQYTHQLEHLGGYYLMHRSLVEHWESVLPERVHLLQYEQVIADHEQETRALLEFCGLPFDQRCLAFHQSERVVRSPSAAQVRQPIYATSVESWKHYEKELAPLRRALAATVSGNRT